MKNESLLSIGQLCDKGCNAVFSKDKLNVYLNNKIILQGTRNTKDGLWDVPFDQQEIRLNYIVKKNLPKYELAQYLHSCAFSPALDTFTKAIKNGNFISWPGINDIDFKKFLINTPAIAKGHLDQERQGLQSTQDEINDYFPPPEDKKTYHVAIKIEPFKPKETAYSDLTGRFPHLSSRGNQYVLVVYDYDSNGILATPLKSRQAQEITEAWQQIHNKLNKHGHTIKKYLLDNECSNDLKLAMIKENLTFELAPPNNHRRNAAERAIRTFKNHFLSGLATCPPDFPITEWDRLIEHAQLTLNLLRNSRINPSLSAQAYLFGNHDFNKVPLLPPGTKVIVHNKSTKRASWAFHGEDGWFIGPAHNHYRCVRCYIPATHATRITDTLSIIPTVIPIPDSTLESKLRQTAIDIVTLLHQLHLPSQTKPFNKPLYDAILQIAMILDRSADPLPIFTSRNTPSLTITEGATPGPKELPLSPMTTKNALPDWFNQPLPIPKLPPLQPPLLNNPIPKMPMSTSPPSSEGETPAFFNNPIPIPTIPQSDESQTLPSTDTINHIYQGQHKETIDTLIEGPSKEVWQQALSNELGRLSQGNEKVSGTDTISFINKNTIPRNKKVTYANMVCDYRPLKSEPYRVRLTVGGDRLDYPHDASSPAATLIDAKLLINSTISDSAKGARFFTIDIKDFFLQSHLPQPEYMRIHFKYFPPDMIHKYELNKIKNEDGFIYCQIKKGMYGLKQAARLAYEQLVQNLKRHGYSPDPIATNIWSHTHRKTKFCLCVDDFGIKYFTKDDAHHLISALQKYYSITTDWTGSNYCGLKIDWNYHHGFADIAMPTYIPNALGKLNHPDPTTPQFAPHRWNRPNYGATQQFAPLEDTTTTLPPSDKTRIQSITGTLLYYGRAVDSTILPAVNDIASTQARPTEQTVNKATMLLDYLKTYPQAKVRFYSSDMVLHADSDAAYLVLPGAKSRVAGYFYLSEKPPKNTPPRPFTNGAIHVECKTLRHVVSSAAEAETAALFSNAKTIIDLRRSLHALGHPQPPTPLKTDNSTACGFVSNFVQQKRSKSWDMRYHWLKEKQNKDFQVYWAPGTNNLADYFTKHHAPSYHKKIRTKYILKGFNMLLNKIQKTFSNTPKIACEGVLLPRYVPYGTSIHTNTGITKNDRWSKISVQNYDIK